MNNAPGARPPYGSAAIVAGAVLIVYVITLAPTVTFWDAGEFIAASRILGIPHPPGTPLFVLIANVWGSLFPFGEFAWRTNLLTAMFSAAGAGLWFLVIWTAIGEERPVLRWGSAAAAAVLSAFTFTVWQNSNETEVYMVATFTIAAVMWLALRWRDARGTARATHILLLIMYLQAVSVGNHLLALLAGPAVLAFVFHEIRTNPVADRVLRNREWAEWFVLAAGWGALTGAGLGSARLLTAAGVMFSVSIIFAVSRRSSFFAIGVLGAIVAGVSIYAVLYVRAGLQPMINEADPSTIDALLAVIRREQYPARTPLDNPIFTSGPENPGRSFDLIVLQVLNYIQYFDWQWARGIDWANALPALSGRLLVTMLFATLGIYGLLELKQRDDGAFWLLLVLFVVTGLGLVAYMNFKPGFSLGWDRFPEIRMHEVRERDYFFVVSFLCWGLFAGVGLLSLATTLSRLRIRRLARAAPAVFGIAVVPLVLNFSAASRRHGPDAELARDFAFDLLQSVEPNGILFTNADNDTFPLWYLQEVEGIRPDVAVVNLELANTPWFIRQLRDRPVRPIDDSAPERYATRAAPALPPPLHDLTDETIDSLKWDFTQRPASFRAGPIAFEIPQNTLLTVSDLVSLILVQRNWDRRPIYWAVTAGENSWRFFSDRVVQEGLVFRLEPDSAAVPREEGLRSPFGTAVDVERTAWLADSVYQYGELFETDAPALEPTSRGIAQNLAFPLLSLTGAYQARGDLEAVAQTLERYLHLRPDPRLATYLASIRAGPDTTDADSSRRP